MIVIHDIQTLRQHLKVARSNAAKAGNELSVGLVPTMGYLHEGHASLLRRAKATSDLVALSIFVNPIQFGPNEDFEHYPRNTEQDLELARREGVDIVFMPSVEEMYPSPTLTNIVVREVTKGLCGDSRPGHFDGVTTVVSKLFHIVVPDHAYFGLKDAQQVAVIQQMVNDLNMNVNIVACPIVREADGLALSSRNVYLKANEREQALVLSQSLREVKKLLDAGQEMTADDIRHTITQNISRMSLAEIDYVDVVAFPSLTKLDKDNRVQMLDKDLLIAIAVKFGKTRLIDNILLEKKGVLSRV